MKGILAVVVFLLLSFVLFSVSFWVVMVLLSMLGIVWETYQQNPWMVTFVMWLLVNILTALFKN